MSDVVQLDLVLLEPIFIYTPAVLTGKSEGAFKLWLTTRFKRDGGESRCL